MRKLIEISFTQLWISTEKENFIHFNDYSTIWWSEIKIRNTEIRNTKIRITKIRNTKITKKYKDKNYKDKKYKDYKEIQR